MIAEGAKTSGSFRQADSRVGLEHFVRDESVSWAEAKNEVSPGLKIGGEVT